MSASRSAPIKAEAEGAPDGILFRGDRLSKSFGGVQAVRDISLTVPRGGVLAIIGPNGAGKSTLLNLMSGLHQPDAGTMRFDGVDLTGLPAHRRVRVCGRAADGCPVARAAIRDARRAERSDIGSGKPQLIATVDYRDLPRTSRRPEAPRPAAS